MQLSNLFPNFPPRSYAGPPHKWDSLFGIELEVESLRTSPDTPSDDFVPAGWTTHQDASLRDGIEFVTSRPIGGDLLVSAIDNFYNQKLRYTNGPRTSTHIHVNMSDATVGQLRVMTILVYAIEDAIYTCTEEARKWGGYSVALAEMRPLRLRNILNAPNDRVFVSNVTPSRNNERYYGFNCNVSRHGTAEFRYFPGGPTKEELISWVDLVAGIKTASQLYTIQNLHDTIDSPQQLRAFLEQNLGAWAPRLMAARSVEDMYVAFETVMAMATDEENPERAGGVVLVTEPLLAFVNTTLLGGDEAAITMLHDSLPRTRLLTETDWAWYVQQAQQVVGRTNSIRNDYEDEGYDAPEYSDEEEEEEPAPSLQYVPSTFAGPESFQRFQQRGRIAAQRLAAMNIPQQGITGRARTTVAPQTLDFDTYWGGSDPFTVTTATPHPTED